MWVMWEWGKRVFYHQSGSEMTYTDSIVIPDPTQKMSPRKRQLKKWKWHRCSGAFYAYLRKYYICMRSTTLTIFKNKYIISEDYYVKKKKHKKYDSVCPLVLIGSLPPPLPPPPGTKGLGTHSPANWGGGGVPIRTTRETAQHSVYSVVKKVGILKDYSELQAKELRARLDWNLKQQTTTFSLSNWPSPCYLLLFLNDFCIMINDRLLPENSWASCSQVGARRLQWPHHGAKNYKKRRQFLNFKTW